MSRKAADHRPHRAVRAAFQELAPQAFILLDELGSLPVVIQRGQNSPWCEVPPPFQPGAHAPTYTGRLRLDPGFEPARYRGCGLHSEVAGRFQPTSLAGNRSDEGGGGIVCGAAISDGSLARQALAQSPGVTPSHSRKVLLR
jgi:hypothetical protein